MTRAVDASSVERFANRILKFLEYKGSNVFFTKGEIIANIDIRGIDSSEFSAAIANLRIRRVITTKGERRGMRYSYWRE